MGLPVRRRAINRAREAGLYLWDGLRPDDSGQVRAVIFGQGRSGKTLLESLICSTGHFEGNEELLNVDRHGEIVWPVRFVRGLAKWRAGRNFLFQVKVYQLTRDRRRPVEPRSFLDALVRHGWRVIHLKRENVVKQALSNVFVEHRAAARGLGKSAEREDRVPVDLRRFVWRVEERFRFQEDESEALTEIDHHTVVYERDLEHPGLRQAAIDGVLEYLGLERRPVVSDGKRFTPATLADQISNYEEFAACVTSRGWQHFLD